MKISKTQLKQIIKEELAGVLSEDKPAWYTPERAALGLTSKLGRGARKLGRAFAGTGAEKGSADIGTEKAADIGTWKAKAEGATEKIVRTLDAINASSKTTDRKAALVKALHKQSGLSSTNFIKIVASNAAASGATEAAEVYITNALAAGTIGRHGVHSRRAKDIVAKARDSYAEDVVVEPADTGAEETTGTGSKRGVPEPVNFTRPDGVVDVMDASIFTQGRKIWQEEIK